MIEHQGMAILEGGKAPLMADRSTLRLGGRVLAEMRLTNVEAAPLLFEEAKRLGGMAFSALRANFLVNKGGGSSVAARERMERARAAVLARHGVELEAEVRLWP